MAILNKILWATMLLLTSSVTLANNLEKNTSVFIDAGGEFGQALLVKHGGACYAIVPTHVVADGSFVTVSGRGLNAPIGDVLSASNMGYDLSVAPIDGEISISCGPLLDSIDRNVDDRLKGSQTAQINMINPDGTVSRIPVVITDQTITILRVKPLNLEDTLMKGMSGSYVTVNNKPLGLLLSVDSASGEGAVIRIDRILETVQPYFSAVAPRMNMVASKGDNLGSQQNLAEKITKWTVKPIDERHRAINLLANEDDIAPWKARKNSSKIQLIIQLKGNKPQVINKVILSGLGLENDKSLARQIEILIDPIGDNRWKSVQAVTVPQNGGIVTASFSDRRAKKVMLYIYNNWGDRQDIGLGRVHISGY